MLEYLLTFCRENGVWGLFILAFADSFISPVMPDILMIPLCIANPSGAVYYGLVATAASVMGGFIGYLIGHKLGPLCITKYIPEQHWTRIQNLIEKHGAWAVFWGAIAPIPYKFVSISAGVLNLNLRLFLFVTLLGRSKRFLLEGILIYFFGPALVETAQRYLDGNLILTGGLIMTIVISYYSFKLFFTGNKTNGAS
ncbi:YqaA family protein [Acetonema longum]|uniref:YqaA family protein n=1 Tax=Acetonema longum TaxID=2374 RepID=UPI0002F6E7BA|nr:VTT domain-containing protein [Acetonema longum]